MFARLLVGTDGSDSASKAVALSAALAKAIGAELVVLHSYPVAKGDVGGPFGGPAGAPTKEIGVSILEDVQKRFSSETKIKTLLKEGDPSDAIVDVAEDEKVDLVVVGNRGMKGPKRYVLGSVPNNVSHHAPASILIVDTTSTRADTRKGGELYSKVLVATDGSPTAGKAAETGAAVAAAVGAEVLLLSVGAEEQTKHVLSQAASHLASSGAKISIKTAAGDPADMIVETAEAEKADLIVVGNKGMTGSKRFLLGSVPNHVSHHAPCDVLIVKTT